MLSIRTLMFVVLLAPLYLHAEDAPWSGALQDGSGISIDPDTNKVTRSWKGETSPLWDGVHHLDNGAVIIVRDGIVVKDMEILKVQQETEQKQLKEACMTLVRKVCGPRNECASHPACDPARQLLLMEDEERHSAWGDITPETSKNCLRSLYQEDFFQACTSRGAHEPLTTCEQLHQRVCGDHNQCERSDACVAAQQLIKMEREDNDAFSSSGGGAFASEECKKKMDDDVFFKACR